MAIQYYYQPADVALDAVQILRRTGVDPTTYGSAGLTSLGIYPVTLVTNPYDTNLYNVVLSFTINGANADQTWTPTAKPLADAKIAGDAQVKESFSAYCNTLFTGDIGNAGLIAIASVATASRGSEFSAPFTSAGTAAGVLQTQMTNIAAMPPQLTKSTTSSILLLLASPEPSVQLAQAIRLWTLHGKPDLPELRHNRSLSSLLF